jgi:Family of unknown function (DUF6502)
MNIILAKASDKAQIALHNALRKVLRPLVRLMLSYGVNYPMVLDDLKRVFISVAEEEFPLEGKAQTNSRITLLTGVHRKDVQRIREIENETPEPPQSIGAQIIGLWLGNKKYLDASGKPIDLPRLASRGEVSFESLVASISKDFRSRPVLDEWLSQGFVSLDNDDFVHLNIQAFIPNLDLEEKLAFFSMNVHDHMAAAESNLNSLNNPMLERCVYYDGLTPENIEILHQFSKQSAMSTIKAVNRRAAALKSAQTETTRRQSDRTTKRMNFGVYFYHADDDKKMLPKDD